MMKLSVLMPVRDAGAFLPATLETLRRQTLGAFELVVVDDGSQDGSAEVVSRLWGPGAVILRPGAVGLVRALTLGLERCRGEVVARMDADDLAHPQRLERQLTYLEAHPETAIVASRVESFTGAGAAAEGHRLYAEWQNALLSHEDLLRERFVESPLSHPSVAFRRDEILALGGYRDPGWPEDYDLWLRALGAGLRVEKLPEVLLRWRDHPGRASRRDPRYGVGAFLRCKAHFLAQGPLRDQEAVIWGSGRGGRRLARHLGAEGVRIRAFIDIDPRKIDGRTVHPPSALPGLAGGVLLACVGSRGARALIREGARAAGRREGVDFFCAA